MQSTARQTPETGRIEWERVCVEEDPARVLVGAQYRVWFTAMHRPDSLFAFRDDEVGETSRATVGYARVIDCGAIANSQ